MISTNSSSRRTSSFIFGKSLSTAGSSPMNCTTTLAQSRGPVHTMLAPRSGIYCPQSLWNNLAVMDSILRLSQLTALITLMMFCLKIQCLYCITHENHSLPTSILSVLCGWATILCYPLWMICHNLPPSLFTPHRRHFVNLYGRTR